MNNIFNIKRKKYENESLTTTTYRWINLIKEKINIINNLHVFELLQFNENKINGMAYYITFVYNINTYSALTKNHRWRTVDDFQ